jgi:hypothetical protein
MTRHEQAAQHSTAQHSTAHFASPRAKCDRLLVNYLTDGLLRAATY